MIDDELMEQYLDDDTEKTAEQKETDAFMAKLEDAKSIIDSEGGFAGLCQHCLDTQKVYIRRDDGYEGIQYRIENELPQIVRCFHGDVEEGMDFPF